MANHGNFSFNTLVDLVPEGARCPPNPVTVRFCTNRVVTPRYTRLPKSTLKQGLKIGGRKLNKRGISALLQVLSCRSTYLCVKQPSIDLGGIHVLRKRLVNNFLQLARKTIQYWWRATKCQSKGARSPPTARPLPHSTRTAQPLSPKRPEQVTCSRV
jgi:hypothetical protein